MCSRKLETFATRSFTIVREQKATISQPSGLESDTLPIELYSLKGAI